MSGNLTPSNFPYRLAALSNQSWMNRSTLKHYSDIVSDIPFGSIYGIFILTYTQTFFVAYTLTSYLTFYLAYFLAYIILTFFWQSIWHLQYFDILSGTLSDVLSGVWPRSGSAH